MTPSISFIIPVRDGAAHLGRCLASIRRAAGDRPIELIVADNGSRDGSGDIARQHGATVLPMPGLRVAAVRNQAARAATADLLAFIDADHELDPGWMDALDEVRATYAEAGAAGAPYDAPPGATWVQRYVDSFRDHPARPAPGNWVGSGNLVVRRATFDAVGGFDASLETCEDVDLCQRLRQAGVTLLIHPGLASIHHGDPRTLAALFNGELWRGRNNLRVSLRGPLAARDLPSILIPLIGVAALIGGLIALLFGYWQVTIAAAAVVLALAALRATVMLRRAKRTAGERRAGARPAGESAAGESPVAARTAADQWQPDWISAFRVALTYDLARALALVIPVGHALRRRKT